MDNPFTAFDWDFVVDTNRELCEKSGFQHGKTSDGYDLAKSYFKKASSQTSLDLPEVAEILRELHKLAPFLFLNGNTFADTGKTILVLTADAPSARLRSLFGHHIAGTEILTKQQLKQAFEDES